jgi:hypothetical protein
MSTGLDHDGQRLMREKLVTIEDSSSVQSSGRLKLNVATTTNFESFDLWTWVA